MSDVKDPKIKLFGKTIELPETSVTAAAAAGEAGGGGSSEDVSNKDFNFAGEAEEQESDKCQSNPKQTDAKQDSQPQAFKSGESKESQINEGSKSMSNDRNSEAVKTSEEQSDTSNSQDKTLKKPDKILPCPRCNSMDTKFCYFNNYNVSQPRHFCKNCQRYWTAGGTMRNVPVGAGRRKNKSQFHLPEALPNGIHLNPNGTFLTFSSDTSLSESMASALNIADKTTRNRPHQPKELQQISVSYGSNENGDSESSVTPTSSKDEIPNSHLFPQFFPGPPWPYPWNSIPCTPPVYGPTFGPTSFPRAPWPYWGSWAVPWVFPPTPTISQSSGPNSPTLGKHSRDDKVESPIVGNADKCLWVPKTLRIDDPGEAAKSSIWETLGIKNERLDLVGGQGNFKVFGSQSKGDDKAHVPETSAILQANPAAFSRSNNFHESS